jgi:hypothetical protein
MPDAPEKADVEADATQAKHMAYFPMTAARHPATERFGVDARLGSSIRRKAG